VDSEYVIPNIERCLDRAHARAAVHLRRDGGIVDERVQLAVGKPALDLGNGDGGVVRICEIDLDVVLGPGLPRALLREGVARAGDDPPACAGESLDGRVADAAACTGQQQGSAWRVRHGSLIWRRGASRVEQRPAPGRRQRLAPEFQTVVQPKRAGTPELEGE